jgi:uncharacterized protein
MDQPPVIPPSPEAPVPPEDPSLRQWVVGMHLSPLSGVLIPFGNIIAPLVIWLLKKTEIPPLDAIGKQVLNYQISWTIWMVVAVIVAAVGSCLVVPIFLPFAVGIAWLVFTVIGSVKASNGDSYKYPLTIDLLK